MNTQQYQKMSLQYMCRETSHNQELMNDLFLINTWNKFGFLSHTVRHRRADMIYTYFYILCSMIWNGRNDDERISSYFRQMLNAFNWNGINVIFSVCVLMSSKHTFSRLLCKLLNLL